MGQDFDLVFTLPGDGICHAIGGFTQQIIEKRIPGAGLEKRLGLQIFAVTAHAQSSLADPFRPPAAIMDPSAAGAADSGPVLQSVLIPKKGKPVAIIGGEAIRVGEMYRDSRLIRLTENEAVLEGPGGIERLPLTPGVSKTPITKSSTKKPATRGAQEGSKP